MNSPVTQGDRISMSASQWNRMQRMSQFGGHRGGGPILAKRQLASVTVQNTTGENLDQFAVVAFGEPVFDVDPDRPESIKAFREGPIFQAEKPGDETTAFGILLEPVMHIEGKGGACGRMLMQGMIPCRLRGPVGRDTAGPETDQTGYLKAGGAGAAILWEGDSEDEDDEEGERWAFVMLGSIPPAIVQGYTSGPVTAPEVQGHSTAVSFDIWKPDPENEGQIKASGKSVTVRNYDMQTTAPAGTRGIAYPIDGEYQWIWLGCSD